jgi:UDP-N-acetylglucosamine 2-epimerase
MKIMSVVGARPNFMKAAPIIAAVREYNNRVSVGAGRGSGPGGREPLQHILVHTNTERPVTLQSETNTLAGVRKEGIREAVTRQLEKTFSNEAPQKWGGNTALRIVEILLSALGGRGTCGSC